MVRPEHVLESWKSVREETVAAVEEFPEQDLDFRITPEVMKFRDIARHIATAGEALTGMLLAGETDLTSGPGFREKMAAHTTPIAPEAGTADLAAALRDTMARRAAELGQRDEAFWAGIVTRMDGAKLTRLEMVQYIKEHELTHRAQLFVCLRLKGMVPSTTRKRLARQAAK